MTIRLLYEYDRWANRRNVESSLNAGAMSSLRELSAAAFVVCETRSSISSGVCWIGLAYWRCPPTSLASLSDLTTQGDALFNPYAFANVKTVQSKGMEIDVEQSES